MSEVKYIILQPIQPPERCYLLEVLYWRAFGRFPEILYDIDGHDARFTTEYRDTIKAYFPEFREITDEECRFASLPPDPRYQVSGENDLEGELEHYQNLVRIAEELDPPDSSKIAKANALLSGHLKLEAELTKWMPLYDDYINQFENEICLLLRRGALVAYGTPFTNNIDDDNDPKDQNVGNWYGGDWPDDETAVPIPQECWISSRIHWEDNILVGHTERYIWVHVNVEDMLRQFPPSMVLDREHVLTGGDTYAVSSSIVPGIARQRSRRGRPPLPWDSFHVQVAKLYRDGEMPKKKEAAIAHFQDWFDKSFGKSASRSAIGEKLKPYFDELGKKDRN